MRWLFHSQTLLRHGAVLISQHRITARCVLTSLRPCAFVFALAGARTPCRCYFTHMHMLLTHTRHNRMAVLQTIPNTQPLTVCAAVIGSCRAFCALPSIRLFFFLSSLMRRWLLYCRLCWGCALHSRSCWTPCSYSARVRMQPRSKSRCCLLQGCQWCRG